jgi:hypothetical protein
MLVGTARLCLFVGNPYPQPYQQTQPQHNQDFNRKAGESISYNLRRTTLQPKTNGEARSAEEHRWRRQTPGR